MIKISYLLKTTNNAIAVITVLAFLFCTISLPVTAKRDKEYITKQIRNIKIDGDLKEWERAEIVAFDELKDVGDGQPKASDFTGQGRVAWSTQDPTRIYFASDGCPVVHGMLSPTAISFLTTKY